MLNTQSFSLIRILMGKMLVASQNPLGCSDILSFFPPMIFSLYSVLCWLFLLSFTPELLGKLITIFLVFGNYCY